MSSQLIYLISLLLTLCHAQDLPRCKATDSSPATKVRLAAGKESYSHRIASSLISKYLEVEELFVLHKAETEQEVIDSLRLVSAGS